MHFNANNVPNGWSDRGDFVVGFIGMTVGVLALFTILSLLPKRTSGVAGVMLFVQYVVSALMCMAFIGVLEFNSLARLDVLRILGRVAVLTPLIAIVGVVIAVVRAGRKATVGYSAVGSTPVAATQAVVTQAVPPSQGRLLAEETQRAPGIAALTVRHIGGCVSGNRYQAAAGADLAEDLTVRGYGVDAVGHHAGVGWIPLPGHQHWCGGAHWRHSSVHDSEGDDPGLPRRADRSAGRFWRLGHSHAAREARIHLARA